MSDRSDRIMAALDRGIDRHRVVDQVRGYIVDQEARAAAGRPVDCREVQIAKATEMLAPAIIDAWFEQNRDKIAAFIRRAMELHNAKRPDPA